MYDREGIFCLVVVIMNYILRALTYKSVKHTVIKACNNKIEQGENERVVLCLCLFLFRREEIIHHFYCEFAMPNPNWGNHGS